ncbi:hypothetical protein SPBR_01138 [Sporothrix brasiliensis 5110]|uniref:Uncharacterized protein n=1 Tax=Sporothrix brasiliensis 5110 TaxID=1398154 RepID=A0A0C2EUM3_9PEZI|nr:uncharacterized protein SPBR_01138 [Sporothrix brasiliensis 5110]KIH90249.1 hypothetical protein SPBR_01138 [Sporothrix brasiliensis 5110]
MADITVPDEDGAQGIGGAFVTMAYTAGAHLFVGDRDMEKGDALAASLRADSAASATAGSKRRRVSARIQSRER